MQAFRKIKEQIALIAEFSQKSKAETAPKDNSRKSPKFPSSSGSDSDDPFEDLSRRQGR